MTFSYLIKLFYSTINRRNTTKWVYINLIPLKLSITLLLTLPNPKPCFHLLKPTDSSNWNNLSNILVYFSSSFYEQHSSISKRATSFGYGTKSELVNKYLFSYSFRYMKTPSPDKYSKVSGFDPIHKRGISIGLGRDDCKNVSIFK